MRHSGSLHGDRISVFRISGDGGVLIVEHLLGKSFLPVVTHVYGQVRPAGAAPWAGIEAVAPGVVECCSEPVDTAGGRWVDIDADYHRRDGMDCIGTTVTGYCSEANPEPGFADLSSLSRLGNGTARRSRT